MPRLKKMRIRSNSELLNFCLIVSFSQQHLDGPCERGLWWTGRTNHSGCGDGQRVPVPHRDTHPGPGEHLQIIFCVSERQNLLAWYVELVSDFFQGRRFVDAAGHEFQILRFGREHIHFSMIPRCYFRTNLFEHHRVPIPNNLQRTATVQLTQVRKRFRPFTNSRFVKSIQRLFSSGTYRWSK